MKTSSNNPIKRAFMRFAIGIGILTSAAALYFYIDEMSVAHREVDGYIPYLLLLRLALAIIIAGAFFSLVYPVTVLGAHIPGILGLNRSAPAGDDKKVTETLGARMLSLILYGLALTAAYFLLRTPLDRAFLPMSGFGWIRLSFNYLYYGLLVLTAGLLAFRTWEMFSRHQGAAAARKQFPAPGVQPPATTGTFFCASCGSANPMTNLFCEKCGERLGS